MLKRLHLPATKGNYMEMALRAEKEGMSYIGFLAFLMAEEIAHRAETRITRSVRKAKFPELMTIEDFDFTFQTSIKRKMLGSYLGPELVTEGRNAIFFGPPGRGKSALSIAIAYKAIQNGYDARFVVCDQLISDLAHAARAGTLQQALLPYVTPHVLVIDELGYLTLPEEHAANVLYHLVNERYHAKKPILLTTNKPLAAWGEVLHDGDLAEAIVDRILARGNLFELRGESYRTRDKNINRTTTGTTGGRKREDDGLNS